VRAQFLAQVIDQIVDTSVQTGRLPAEDARNEFLTRKRLPRLIDQQLEKLELRSGEIESLALKRYRSFIVISPRVNMAGTSFGRVLLETECIRASSSAG
jgi:hypothetical protein